MFKETNYQKYFVDKRHITATLKLLMVSETLTKNQFKTTVLFLKVTTTDLVEYLIFESVSFKFQIGFRFEVLFIFVSIQASQIAESPVKIPFIVVPTRPHLKALRINYGVRSFSPLSERCLKLVGDQVSFKIANWRDSNSKKIKMLTRCLR